MSIPLFETLQSLDLAPPQGILQLGASYGQELPLFLDKGVAHGVFIEPLPQPYAHLAQACQRIAGYVAVQALCTDESGKRYTFHLASNGGMSSSILPPANHLKVFSDVKFEGTVELVSHTVDDVTAFLSANGHQATVAQLDTLYMDTQGAELKILMGANRTLKSIKYIFTEVMRAELYAGQTPFSSFCAWLDASGYTLNNVYFDRHHAGDALFIRKDVLGL
ncbi:FkbM family methyltransferase [Aquabacterium sp. A7-Y]|uniref:FkbM family methyltransferase n=1 Tax=Aquabacterium sp. A7-Y TaxID=1349605 RepID=UPI00223D66E9|nr:FkbM family methyltransferase [Aquabacterium sp. A7-Y]MCW7539428.1 FkbM family methyltransferase [Aquabacterium sp. A7-Y]